MLKLQVIKRTEVTEVESVGGNNHVLVQFEILQRRSSMRTLELAMEVDEASPYKLGQIFELERK
jgi:hypothetical protein